MKLFLKRVGAYLIDIVIVSLISTFLTTNTYINKDYDKYSKVYDEYVEVYEDYTESIEKLEKKLNKEEIKEKEYNKKLEKLENDYKEKELNYNYRLVKLSIIPTIISVFIILLYFVGLQCLLKGQTIGKKIMSIKIVSNNDKKLNVLNYLLRCLIVNEVFINIFNIIFVLILNKSSYLVYSKIIYFITYILEMSIIFTMSFSKNKRGIQDYIANTKVIDLLNKEVD